jgi:hypothetical protein
MAKKTDANIMMKTAAIYNVWDGVELLEGSMKTLGSSIDLFIIVHQDISNFGEKYNPLEELDIKRLENEYDIVWIKYIPKGLGMKDERDKRNLGISIAKQHGCTHFIAMDCDEYYTDFKKGKQLFVESGHDGSVVKLITYFKSPQLRYDGLDNYYVPFIHRLHKHTMTGAPRYPYYVDPTRRINASYVLEIPIVMHHYSWIRKDIFRKVRNSSARENIKKSTLLEDYENAHEGMMVEGKRLLVSAEDIFGINKTMAIFV